MTDFISRPYYQALTDYGRRHPEVVAITGDLTKSCEAEGFQETFPDRFFNMGMAEQNMIGVAGGLAYEGFLPVVHTFGVFITRRAYDQVQMSLGARRARVRLMGFLPGITTPGGVTHQAIDDVAVMGSVPGMTVVDPGDATEIRSVLEAVHHVEGPVFVRMVRGDVPILFDTPMQFGKVRVLSEGEDILVVSSSVGTWEALAAVRTLRSLGKRVGHAHVSTVKPLDDPRLAAMIRATRNVVTVENHLTEGGLGSRVAEIIADGGYGTRLRRLGLKDRYGGAGALPYLVEVCGISARHILATAAEMMGDPALAAAGAKALAQGAGDLDRQEAL
jgi:transketolase